MNTIRLPRLITVLLTLCLASCASPGNPQIHQARGQFQSRKTYAQGIVGGALVGALAGVALAAANGGNGDALARGAIIGGSTGAVAGGVYANQVVQQRRAYAAREGALDNAIANAASTRHAAAEFNKALARELHKEQSHSATKAGTLADAQSVLKSVNREISAQSEALADASSQGIPPRDQQRLKNEISGLEAESRQLKRMLDTLNNSPTVIPVATGR